MLVRSSWKPFKPGFSITWTENFQMFKLGLARQRNQRSNCQHLLSPRESKGVPEKHLPLCFIDYAKVWLVWITTNCGKPLKRWEYHTILPVSWETCIQVKKQNQNLIWNNWLVQNWERSRTRLLTDTMFIQLICRVHQVKCQTGWSTSWNQDCKEKHQ